ncbi:MAG: sulfotransferase domain-containing protein [Rhodospirillales bacterium]
MGGIIWLASYPKSGNTWLRAFLHNFMRNATQPIEPNRLNELTLGDGQERFFLSFTAGRPTVELSLQEIANLRSRVQGGLAASSPDSVFVKTHNWLGADHGVPCIDMRYTAGAIYVVRNPLDVVLSLADHFGLSIDQAILQMEDTAARTANMVHRVPDVMSSWSNHVRSWTQEPNPRLHVMRYEDMLAQPVSAFVKLAQFLELPQASRDRIERAIEFSSFDTLQKMESSKGFVERSSHSPRFFRRGKSGQWQEALTAEQVRRLTASHQSQMQRFGYWPLTPAERRKFAIG